MSRSWDAAAYAEQMKQSTSPVSAFFLIDSPEAIERCTRWLEYLTTFNMPRMEGSPYFRQVRAIYEAQQEVMNVDHSFTLVWEKQAYPAGLRCHSVDKGRYEIELWLPGMIANAIVDRFADGREGFFCAFLPPAFYD